VTETGLFANKGTASSNTYLMQLNTNSTLPSTASCQTALAPSSCTGWQQFVYDSYLKEIQVEPALIDYMNTCTGTFKASDGNGNCYDENEGTMSVPQLTPGELSSDSVELAGQADSTTDTVKLLVSGTAYAATAADDLVDLSGNWTEAQFGVYGDRGGGQAVFSAGTDMKVSLATHSGTTAEPHCMAFNTTAESNNLYLQPAPTVGTQPSPTMETDQSSSPPTSPASCAAAQGVGDTHLETFNSLFYDYQAQGDYELVSTGAPPSPPPPPPPPPSPSPPPAPRVDTAAADSPATTPPGTSVDASRFVVQERQVSGAPNWPDAAVNQAVAAQVGPSDVAVCTAPTRLEINGNTANLADGAQQYLPDGASVTVNGNVYLIRDGNGNSVQATVQSGNTPHIDVSVGLGYWPEPVQGLLANAGNSDNAIESSSGTVFTAPFVFSQIYGAYGSSWLVPVGQDLLSACNGEAGAPVSSNPTQPFYAANLPSEVGASARQACVAAGVQSASLLDACTVDVAVLGEQAADPYQTFPAPAVWGVVGTGCQVPTNTAHGNGLSAAATADACSPPSTLVLLPRNKARLFGLAYLDATASPGVTSVQYELRWRRLREQVIATAALTIFGWVAHWDTTKWPNGTYKLQSIATSANGVTGTSPPVTVRVRN
jgi:hypothetical protein